MPFLVRRRRLLECSCTGLSSLSGGRQAAPPMQPLCCHAARCVGVWRAAGSGLPLHCATGCAGRQTAPKLARAHRWWQATKSAVPCVTVTRPCSGPSGSTSGAPARLSTLSTPTSSTSARCCWRRPARRLQLPSAAGALQRRAPQCSQGAAVPALCSCRVVDAGESALQPCQPGQAASEHGIGQPARQVAGTAAPRLAVPAGTRSGASGSSTSARRSTSLCGPWS